MDNLNMNNNAANQGRPGTFNGQEGTWVPVDSSAVPFSVSQDINNPTMAPDGSYYYAEGGNMNNGGFGQIAANYNNAIPTPSQIVQLPPIVQPIALVPYASQNQPLLQYDPNERPAIEVTPTEPVYRAKPYAGLSVITIVFALLVCAAAVLINAIKAVKGVTAIDSVFGIASLFGLGNLTSGYYENVLSVVFAGGFSAGFSADMTAALFAFLIPVFYALALIFAVILVIYYLAKLAKKSNPAGFNVLAFIGFLFTAANVAIMFISDAIDYEIGAFVIAGAFLLVWILPLFAKKNAQILDYRASKRTYIQE